MDADNGTIFRSKALRFHLRPGFAAQAPRLLHSSSAVVQGMTRASY